MKPYYLKPERENPHPETPDGRWVDLDHIQGIADVGFELDWDASLSKVHGTILMTTSFNGIVNHRFRLELEHANGRSVTHTAALYEEKLAPIKKAHAELVEAWKNR